MSCSQSQTFILGILGKGFRSPTSWHSGPGQWSCNSLGRRSGEPLKHLLRLQKFIEVEVVSCFLSNTAGQVLNRDQLSDLRLPSESVRVHSRSTRLIGCVAGVSHGSAQDGAPSLRGRCPAIAAVPLCRGGALPRGSCTLAWAVANNGNSYGLITVGYGW